MSTWKVHNNVQQAEKRIVLAGKWQVVMMSAMAIVPRRLCLALQKVVGGFERRLLKHCGGPHGIKSLIAAIIIGKVHLEAK